MATYYYAQAFTSPEGQHDPAEVQGDGSLIAATPPPGTTTTCCVRVVRQA